MRTADDTVDRTRLGRSERSAAETPFHASSTAPAERGDTRLRHLRWRPSLRVNRSQLTLLKAQTSNSVRFVLTAVYLSVRIIYITNKYIGLRTIIYIYTYIYIMHVHIVSYTLAL